ncbi:sugar phosphate isomerase/epimerase family protein [Diplocloster hominis]|uniref:sugar phosphate isomerase/epimerase family protein n=1 Tax=Diplocloster hominis TaxID=3079010 RepID=UPI0031BA1A8B
MPERKLGICEWEFPLPGIWGMEKARDMGITGYQLTIGSYARGLPLTDRLLQDAYLEQANRLSMEFPSLSMTPLMAFGLSNPWNSPKAQTALALIQEGIRICSHMHIPVMMLCSARDGEICNEEHFQNTCRMLTKACDLAADYGITIASENLLDIQENLRLCRTIGRRNFGIFFDTQNPCQAQGYHVPNMIRALGDHIVMVHLKDGVNRRNGSCLLGTGENSFLESAGALNEISYSGYLILENSYASPPLVLNNLQNPLELVQKDIKTVRQLFIDNRS